MTFIHTMPTETWNTIKELGSFMAPVADVPAEMKPKEDTSHVRIDLEEWDWREGDEKNGEIPITFSK